MSVEIVENWIDIEGTIQSINYSSNMKDFFEIKILIDSIAEVPGYPNLLGTTEDSIITVHIKKTIAQQYALKKGQKIACRVRRASLKKYFIHPNFISIQNPS